MVYKKVLDISLFILISLLNVGLIYCFYFLCKILLSSILLWLLYKLNRCFEVPFFFFIHVKTTLTKSLMSVLFPLTLAVCGRERFKLKNQSQEGSLGFWPSRSFLFKMISLVQYFFFLFVLFWGGGESRPERLRTNERGGGGGGVSLLNLGVLFAHSNIVWHCGVVYGQRKILINYCLIQLLLFLFHILLYLLRLKNAPPPLPLSPPTQKKKRKSKEDLPACSSTSLNLPAILHWCIFCCLLQNSLPIAGTLMCQVCTRCAKQR